MAAGGFMADTDVLVAAFCGRHDRHEEASGELNRRLSRAAPFYVAAHTLIETYAVLTRLPSPHRLSPNDAFAVLAANLKSVRVVTLDAADHWRCLSDLKDRGMGGGLTYDALIIYAAKKAGVQDLLTYNIREFQRLRSGAHPDIIQPGA